MNPATRTIIVILSIGAVGGAIFWLRHPAPLPATQAAPASGSSTVVAALPPVPPPAPAGPPPPPPAVRHPLAGRVGPAGALPALDASDGAFAAGLSGLLGHKSLTRFLALDDFARHFVATVDNLATDNAAADLWPVRRTPGRFLIAPGAETLAIAQANADRYTPLVRLLEAIDTDRAVSLYRHFYPLLQRAYEELGYPGRYFNDRVVEVIDQLRATPQSPLPLAVKRVALAGMDSATTAGGAADAHALFVYADPALEACSAGQKILLRVGPDHAAHLKAKLADVRQRLVEGPRAPGSAISKGIDVDVDVTRAKP